MISGIVSVISDLATGWLKDRAAIKKAKVEAKIEEIKYTHGANKNADEIALKNMERSWKDEFVLLIFVGIMVAAFIPDAQPYIKEGFQVLDTVPEWYKILLIGMIATIMGLRWIVQPFINVMTKNKGDNNG